MNVHIPGSTEPHGVESQIEYFDEKFRSLINKAYEEVNEIKPSDFLVHVTCLPAYSRPQHRTFIEEKLMDVPSPVTFVKIWSILNLYWDFLNYGLLEHVIRNFGSEDLKHRMQDYIDEFSEFKRRTRLCDFVDSWPDKAGRPSEEGLRKVVVKKHLEWTQCTLHDVESFMAALIQKFCLPEFDIILQNAQRGCVCVTWLTSPSIATLLQQNLPNIEMEFFKQHSIDSVTIVGQDIYLTHVKKYGALETPSGCWPSYPN